MPFEDETSPSASTRTDHETIGWHPLTKRWVCVAESPETAIHRLFESENQLESEQVRRTRKASWLSYTTRTQNEEDFSFFFFFFNLSTHTGVRCLPREDRESSCDVHIVVFDTLSASDVDDWGNIRHGTTGSEGQRCSRSFLVVCSNDYSEQWAVDKNLRQVRTNERLFNPYRYQRAIRFPSSPARAKSFEAVKGKCNVGSVPFWAKPISSHFLAELKKIDFGILTSLWMILENIVESSRWRSTVVLSSISFLFRSSLAHAETNDSVHLH